MKNLFLFFVLAMFSINLHAQTTISSSVSITQTEIDGYTWPVIINGGTEFSPVVVTLAADITLSDLAQCFFIESEYVVFDGDNKIITIDNVIDYPGLLKNGSSGVNGYNYVAINNVIVSSVNSGLLSEGGWIGQSNFGLGSDGVDVTNCSSTGDITNSGGGIIGAYSSCTVINCHSSGAINNTAGGIFGTYGSGTAINCYSSGNGGEYSGGIFGYGSGGNASYCHSVGMIGLYGGGIFGGGATGGTATNCHSTGDIGDNGGGITGESSRLLASDCYSAGSIGQSAGGIFGAAAPAISTATNCYSTGSIGINAGGITGQYCEVIVINCYSTGLIDPDGGGGITGLDNTGTTSTSYSCDGTWNSSDAAANLDGVGTTWIECSINTPYKLSSYNKSIYSPDSANIPGNTTFDSPVGNFYTGTYSLVNGDPSATINAGSGMISIDNTASGSFTLKILFSDNSDGSYQISDYTVNVMSTLPMTWRSFTVTPRGKDAWLQWSTASEQNTRDFNVQHSINGNSWMTIGTVAAAGNSTSISNYSFLHAGTVTGSNYYRIQQTDKDGKYTYSSIKQLQIAGSNKIFTVLNTVVNNGVLQVETKVQGTLYLYYNDGKLIWQKQFNTGLQHIDLGAVSKGVYFLKGTNAVVKIVVQ